MTGDPIDLRSQEEQEHARQQLDQIHDFFRVEDFKTVVSTVNGRRFVWTLLEMTGVYHQTMDGTEMGTAFNEGKRNIGLQLIALLHETSPELYVKMIEEKRDYDEHVSNIQRNGRQPTDG